MIKVEGLKKTYGAFQALKSISFEVEKGSVFGFIGPNGAGKTTTMNILTGLLSFDSGKITIKGEDLDKNKRDIIKYIGYLPENPEFYEYMNAHEYLGFISDISKTEIDNRQKRIQGLLETVGLKKDSKRKIGGYSKGMRQRLALAVALFDSPSILFLDEPSSALDPEGRLEMLNLIDRLKKENITIFLSTHILNDAERVCDTVCIIDEGRIFLSERLEGLYQKYTRPVFDIEFESDPKIAVERLGLLDWVEHIDRKGNRVSLEVKDLMRSKKKIFHELAGLEETAISYQVRKMSLEDIFIRIINKDANF